VHVEIGGPRRVLRRGDRAEGLVREEVEAALVGVVLSLLLLRAAVAAVAMAAGAGLWR